MHFANISAIAIKIRNRKRCPCVELRFPSLLSYVRNMQYALIYDQLTPFEILEYFHHYQRKYIDIKKLVVQN